jgi:hypothetical protein
MFIEVLIILENVKLAEMGVTDEVHTPIKIKVAHIDAYRSFVDDNGSIVDNEVMIYMENGVSFSVKATMAEIDKKIEEAC